MKERREEKRGGVQVIKKYFVFRYEGTFVRLVIRDEFNFVWMGVEIKRVNK